MGEGERQRGGGVTELTSRNVARTRGTGLHTSDTSCPGHPPEPLRRPAQQPPTWPVPAAEQSLSIGSTE
jgi:hypothetical protein